MNNIKKGFKPHMSTTCPYIEPMAPTPMILSSFECKKYEVLTLPCDMEIRDEKRSHAKLLLGELLLPQYGYSFSQ